MDIDVNREYIACKKIKFKFTWDFTQKKTSLRIAGNFEFSWWFNIGHWYDFSHRIKFECSCNLMEKEDESYSKIQKNHQTFLNDHSKSSHFSLLNCWK
jgi:hypothetical protein